MTLSGSAALSLTCCNGLNKHTAVWWFCPHRNSEILYLLLLLISKTNLILWNPCCLRFPLRRLNSCMQFLVLSIIYKHSSTLLSQTLKKSASLLVLVWCNHCLKSECFLAKLDKSIGMLVLSRAPRLEKLRPSQRCFIRGLL